MFRIIFRVCLRSLETDQSTASRSRTRCMDNSKRSETPDVIPHTGWSDLKLYMTSTPSLYTKEEIKIEASYFCFAIMVLIARLGKGCLMEIVFFRRVGFMLEVPRVWFHRSW